MVRRGGPFVVLVLIAQLAGCSSSSGGDGDSTEPSRTGVFGRVVDVDGAPVPDARVALGGRSVSTDAAGDFALGANAGDALVAVAADGFVATVLPVRVIDGAASALTVTLLPQREAGTLDAATGGTVVGVDGASLTAPPNAFVGPAGAASGALTVFLTPLDPTRAAELAAAPGDFTAVADGRVELLESFGMMDVTVMAGDQELNIADGQRVEVRIPAAGDDAPETIALWSFDESSGRWSLEGSATLDTATSTYVAELTHLSWWNADQVLDTTCGRGCVVDSGGDPVAGARVTASGLDYAGTSSAQAGADGCFVVAVRKNARVSVSAAHALGGGEVREVNSGANDTDVPPSDPAACDDWGTWTVEQGEVVLPDGTVVDCAGVEYPLADCLPVASTLFECFDPAGACTYEGMGSSAITYANGARMEIATDLSSDPPTTVITYTGSSGVVCGVQTLTQTSAGEAGPFEAEVQVDAPGGSATFGYRMASESSDVTYRCEDGSTEVVTAAAQQQIEVCFGGSDTEECTYAGGGLPGSACTNDAECGGLTCCALPGTGTGICLEASLCQLEEDCSSDEDCTSGQRCCANGAGLLMCQPTDDCGGPECVDSTDCGGSACCDGVCVASNTCDDGICADDSECAAGEVCCTGSGNAYCSAPDSCFSGADCTTDAECGADRGGSLICCLDGADSGTCEEADTCGVGDPCAGDGDCQGTQVCCTVDGSTQLCQAAADCGRFAPCTADSDCGDAHICCERDGSSYCDLEATCALGASCTTDAECGASGALECCSFGGAGLSLCVETGTCP